MQSMILIRSIGKPWALWSLWLCKASGLMTAVILCADGCAVPTRCVDVEEVCGCCATDSMAAPWTKECVCAGAGTLFLCLHILTSLKPCRPPHQQHPFSSEQEHGEWPATQKHKENRQHLLTILDAQGIVGGRLRHYVRIL